MRHKLEIWVRSTLAGFLAWGEGAPADAAAHWRSARALAQQEELLITPFHAVACTTLVAVAGRDERDAHLAAAVAAWDGVSDRIAREDLPLPARSSAFHLRLAGQHAEAFSAFLRQRALALADLGRFIAKANALAGPGQTAALQAHLATYEPPTALVPAFLEEGLRAARDAPSGATVAFSRAAAERLLAAQIAYIRSFSAQPLPTTLAAQLDAGLGFCAFAPLLAALAPGRLPRSTEFGT